METQFADRTLVLDSTRVGEIQRALQLDALAATPRQPMPLGFFMYVTTIGVEEVNAATGFDPLRFVYGGTELEIERIPAVGDELIVRSGVARRWDKQTSGGMLRFAEIACDYLLGNDVAIRERTTVIERPRGEEGKP